MKPIKLPIVILIALAIVVLTGCNDNERVAWVATQAADRQAEQNKEMARVNREVAEGTKRLVEADAKAREETLAMQKNLQEQQAEVSHQRDQLESERRAIAKQRVRDSILAPILIGAGPLLVSGLALALCWFLLFGLRRENNADIEVGEILIEELVSERPVLLPPATSLELLEDRGVGHVAIGDQTGADAGNTKET